MKKFTIAAAVIAAFAAFTLTAAAAIDTKTEIRPGAEAEPAIPGNHSPAHVSSDHVPRPAGNALANSDAALDLAGLNFEDHRTADGGNQFSVEPPDQALCVGNGLVMEAVNIVFRFRNATTGAPWAASRRSTHSSRRTTQSTVRLAKSARISAIRSATTTRTLTASSS